MLIKRIIFFINFLLISTFVTAQNSLSLKTCVKLAIDNSYIVKSNNLRMKNHELQKKISKKDYFPTINFTGTHNYYFGNTIDPTTFEFINQNVQTNTFQLLNSYNITNIIKTYNSINYIEANLQIEVLNKKINVREITFDVHYTYYKILKKEKTIKYLEKQLKDLDLMISSYETLVANGVTNREVLLLFQIERNKELIRLLKLQQEIKSSYIEMQTITNTKIIQIEDIPEEQLIGLSLITTDELKNVELSLKKQRFYMKKSQEEIRNKIRKLSIYPSLYLNMSMRSNYNNLSERVVDQVFGPSDLIGFTASGEQVRSFIPSISSVTDKNPFINQLRENNNFYIGAGLSFQISNLIKRKKEQELHLNNINQIENTILEIESETGNHIRELKNAIAVQKSIFSIKKDNFIMLEDVKKIKEEQLLNNLITANDFISNRREYTKSKIDLLETLFQIIFMQTELNYGSN